ncbi:transposase [Klebsiella pneumoniae]|nr:transposase [Klebsiella pneumoniae]OWA56149.1 transposase [Klebsiella pneumoniae]OWA73768.1 transposase [Klebsiella pneumoniae]OWA74553.1 transposase [Klebsiella pneumoniae]OWB02052.1 transposase [Klebsiella pneumoniae]
MKPGVLPIVDLCRLVWGLKWFTEFGHLNRGDMLTSEQHRCHNEKKKFQRRV